MKSALALLGAFATSALGHGTVPNIRADGVVYGAFHLSYYWGANWGQPIPDNVGWYAENVASGFLKPSEYKSSNFSCHVGAKPGAASAKVAAGGIVEFLWTDWNHFGPVMTYVAKCPASCSTVDKDTLKWVKIDEAGIDVPTQKWAAREMKANNNTWATTVPASLAPGNYVFRHETINLDGAFKPDGAQHYPQCFNIEITGSGTDNPKGVLSRDLYTPDHPGIAFNNWKTPKIAKYEIPGPPLYTSSNAAAPKPATPQSTTPEAAAPEPVPSNSASLDAAAPNTTASKATAPKTNAKPTTPKSKVKACRAHSRKFKRD